MPERLGPWDLLDRESDPVVADDGVIDDRVAHYRKIADEMLLSAQRLDRIADGSALEGAYADELRATSGEVARDLHRVVDRYGAVAGALTAYQPELDRALAESQGALDDAMTANGSKQAADGMPTATAADGQQLTADQVAANDEKTARTNQAADALSAAKQRLTSALGALDAAGHAAAATIRAGFDDGLKDSGWDRFVHGFMKFLKILVKILTYIAMALAVIALIIPGLGEAILAIGVALAAVDVAANAVLAGTGNGSWADFGVAIAGLLTFGVGKVLGPAIEAALTPIRSSIKGGIQTATASVRNALPDIRIPNVVPRLDVGAGRAPVRASDFPSAPTHAPGGPEFPDVPTHTPIGRSDFPDVPTHTPTGTRPPSVSSAHSGAGSSVDDADVAAGDAITNYTGGGFDRINQMLRGTRTFAADEQASLRDTVAALRQRIADLPDAGEVTTYRGLVGDLFADLRPGRDFTDAGFFSTSFDRSSAEGFIATGGKLNGINQSGFGTLLHIQGTGGREIGHLNALGEREVLYDAGTTFHIDGMKSLMESIRVNGQEIKFRVIFLRSHGLERE